MYMEQLYYFKQVCESHSLNKAAEKLFITQSALTRSIQKLETEFGVPLLIRNKKGVYPTELGLIVLQKFSQMITLYEEAFQEVHHTLTFEMPFVIFSVPAISNTIASAMINRLHHDFCHLDIQFQEILPRNIDVLYKYQHAIALTFHEENKAINENSFPELTVRTIKTEPVYYFLSKNHPLSSEKTLNPTLRQAYPQIAFRNFQKFNPSFDVGNSTIYCNSAAVSEEFILNQYAIHPLPLTLGKHLYTHPDIIARPCEDTSMIAYESIWPKKLMQTNYAVVIKRTIALLNELLF